MKDRFSNKQIAGAISAIIVVLMAIGVVFVASASAQLDREYDFRRIYSYPEFRQTIFFLLSIIVLYLSSLIDYHRLGFKGQSVRYWFSGLPAYLVAFSAVLLVIVLFFGEPINHSKRWLQIPLGPITMSFQPSELAKWSLVFFLAAAIAQSGDKIRLFWKRFVPLCAVAAVVIGLIVIEDFGTAFFVAALVFAMTFAGGVRLWHFLTPVPVLAAAFYFAVALSQTRMNRLRSFFTPDINAMQTTGYQITQSLIAIGSGGILGKGLGRGISKYGHLPEDTTDFIFAVISEELGFIGAVSVILLFIAFVVLGIMVVRRCEDKFGKLLAFGIVLTISAQAVMNMGVVTHLLPTKGIALPFVSAGGTGMLLGAAAAGVLVNIAKNCGEQDRL
ncbi:MAG: FtsW/RodA/SpoVE family cell cycle protein [Planctomycetes bacterium]|nr:FtsW/RodA/SpoVE family cell cycle protein [Planctomycetota bacterium]